MGHITLSAPVAHVWYLRGVPSRIGLYLGVSIRDLEKVVYFASFIVKSVDEKLKESILVKIKKELKDFEKVFLKPGEQKTIRFHLNRRSLAFYDPYEKAWVAEPGKFEVLVGSSSRDIRARAGFHLNDK